MPHIELTGLKSGVPIGFMAALGAFRHVSEIPEMAGVKLGWKARGGQWCALFETPEEISPDHLAQLFAERVEKMAERPEFDWSPAVKSATVGLFRDKACEALEHADSQLAAWFQAFATELVHEDEVLESTPFDMTVARQLFLDDARKLTAGLAGDADAFQEALFGPWKYADRQHSLGWDPSTKLMGAFTPKAPTQMNKAGVRGAVWLAMESLPLFPVFYARGLATCGFVRRGRRQSFRWGVWEQPLSMTAVRTLIAQVPGVPAKERRGRGLCAIYSSAVYKPNKYLTCFQPAVLDA